MKAEEVIKKIDELVDCVIFMPELKKDNEYFEIYKTLLKAKRLVENLTIPVVVKSLVCDHEWRRNPIHLDQQYCNKCPEKRLTP